MDTIKWTNISHPWEFQEKKREKVAENLFKEIKVENSLYLGTEIYIQVQESQRTPSKIKPKMMTHYNQNARYQRENFKSSLTKMTQHIQKNPHKAISGFLCKNLAYQKKVGGSIQSDK